MQNTINPLSAFKIEPLKTYNFLPKTRKEDKKGLIHNPLQKEDIANLSFLLYVWQDKVLLQSALAKFSKKRRMKLLQEIGLTKPETYVLNRYLNTDAKLYLKQVVDELNHYYKVPKSVAVKIVKK